MFSIILAKIKYKESLGGKLFTFLEYFGHIHK